MNANRSRCDGRDVERQSSINAVNAAGETCVIREMAITQDWNAQDWNAQGVTV